MFYNRTICKLGIQELGFDGSIFAASKQRWAANIAMLLKNVVITMITIPLKKNIVGERWRWGRDGTIAVEYERGITFGKMKIVDGGV